MAMVEAMDQAMGAPGGVTGGPKLLLRLEGLALAGAAVTLYAYSGSSWWLFAVLLLAPDLSFLGYGLKYSAGFGFTHLGRIGKDAAG